MMKRKECTHCKTQYDATYDECPKCKTPNDTQSPEFRNLTMLHLGKQLALFLMGIAGLEIFVLIYSSILNSFPNIYQAATPELTSLKANMILNTLCYSTMFVGMVCILNFDIKKLFKSFKSWKPYVAGAVCVVATLLLNYGYLLILNLAGVKIGNNNNEAGLVSMTSIYPFSSILIFGIIGPICEELAYRVGLFSSTKRISKWVAYPITIIIFTLIHFDFTAANMSNELLNLPLYIFGATFITITYDKFGFAGSLTAHILNNLISLLTSMVVVGAIR